MSAATGKVLTYSHRWQKSRHTYYSFARRVGTNINKTATTVAESFPITRRYLFLRGHKSRDVTYIFFPRPRRLIWMPNRKPLTIKKKWNKIKKTRHYELHTRVNNHCGPLGINLSITWFGWCVRKFSWAKGNGLRI